MQLPERKRSDVRSAMRFGKNAFFDRSGNGSGSDFQRSSLSGHASQLSLQSAISSSTSVSWNAIATAAAAVSTTLIGNRSSSPTHSNYAGGDPVKPSPLSICFALFCLSVALTTHFETAQIGACRPPFALDLDEAGQTTATVEASNTTGLLNDTDHRSHESTAPTANTDEEEEEAGGGGTTEDTEDGETEDEERPCANSTTSAFGFGGDSVSLFENGDFSHVDTASLGLRPYDRSVVPYPAASDYGDSFRTDDSGSFSPTDVQAVSPGSDEVRPNMVSAVSINSPDGFINTCVNSGTSTFRRRQSEYGRKGQHITNDNLVTSRPVEYTSMTPALARRAVKLFHEFAATGIIHQHKLSNVVTLPISAPHYASVSTSSNYSQQANGTPTRSDRFPCVGLPLTPPPLATIPAPAYSKNNQLMFGVKVLPNQTPPMIGINSINQYSRLPQCTRQNNHESGQFAPTQASTGMGSPLLSRASYSQRGVLPPKPANNVVREDAITIYVFVYNRSVFPQTRQDMVDSCGGRPRSRPVNPPRRSSSVSRDMTRIRNSSTDPYPTCAFQPTTSAYHLQSNLQHRENGDGKNGEKHKVSNGRRLHYHVNVNRSSVHRRALLKIS
ncbi:hypothetical protein AHF37_05209 [Paragonimus kellicotti]|nr:hypothetical protein AHF37_05209 [Paragonimus kellicotti]